MPTVYNKLFTKILDSSIWLASDTTRIVWITLIAAMDEDGFCPFATVENLAARARVELKAAKKAVAELESPEPETATADNDGRRIERVPGGWLVINASKYRQMVTRLVVREQTRERVKRHRARNASVTACNAPVLNVTPSEAVSGSEAESTYKRSGIPNSEKEAIEWASMGGVPPEFASELFHQCEGRDWVDGAGQAIVSWRSYSKQRWVKRQGETAAKAKGSNRPMDLKIILEAKKTQADELKAKHRSETAMGANWSDEQARQNYLRLRGEIKELTQKIGALA